MNLLRINGRLILLDFLAVLFGISSWISINGLWVELPLLVERLPEGWGLASYLSIIIQLANLGPLSYAFLRWLTKGKIPEKLCIYILLVVGTASGFMLSRFWDKEAEVLGTNHSLALFILVFFLSLVDCTSSILFLPFMAVFRDIYLNSYLIGEGLSGFIPSIAALVQGVGGNAHCQNVTVPNETTGIPEHQIQKVVPEPRFSIEVFFDFLGSMMALSTLAFLLLNILPPIKNEHASKHQIIATSEVAAAQEEAGSNHSANEEREEEEQELDPDAPVWIARNQRNVQLTDEQKAKARLEFYTLLVIQASVCFLSNGALPSIQTYSCLPYGNTVYHLSVTLNAMANPLMAFGAFFVPCTSSRVIKILTASGLVFVVYILATAFYSPNMLAGQGFGGFMTVASWVIYGGLFSYVKVSIAGKCRQISSSALFWCGAVTQLGSAIGALIFFLLVNYANVFQGYYVTCTDDDGQW